MMVERQRALRLHTGGSRLVPRDSTPARVSGTYLGQDELRENTTSPPLNQSSRRLLGATSDVNATARRCAER